MEYYSGIIVGLAMRQKGKKADIDDGLILDEMRVDYRGERC